MFQSRVSGIGMDLSSPTQYTPAEIAMQNARAKYASDMALWEKNNGESYSKVIDGCPRCITYPCPCPAANEFLRLNPEPVMQQIPGGAKDLYPTRPGWDSLQLIEKSAPAPAPVPVLAVAKPTALSLPLLLGAAYLLLS